MELAKIKIDELRNMDKAQLKETVSGVEKELITLRMDVYTQKGKSIGKQRNLKKTRARALFVLSTK